VSESFAFGHCPSARLCSVSGFLFSICIHREKFASPESQWKPKEWSLNGSHMELGSTLAGQCRSMWVGGVRGGHCATDWGDIELNLFENAKQSLRKLKFDLHPPLLFAPSLIFPLAVSKSWTIALTFSRDPSSLSRATCCVACLFRYFTLPSDAAPALTAAYLLSLLLCPLLPPGRNQLWQF